MDNDRWKITRIIVLAYIIMVVFGFFMNLRGPVIPQIREGFAVNYSSIGLMMIVNDIGYMASTFFSGIVGEKLGIKSILLYSFSIIGISVMAMGYINSFSLLIIIMFFIATAMGCFEIGLNSIGARVFTSNAAVMMNLLHLFYGIGSIISPKYAGWLLSKDMAWSDVYLYSLWILVPVFLFLLTTPFPAKQEEHKSVKIPFKEIAKDKRVWLLAGVLGFCITAEVGIGNWLINFLQAVHSMNENDSSLYLSLFFVTFTIGRLVGGFLAEKLGYVNILLYFTIMYVMFFAAGLVGSQFLILFSLTGFSVSIMYPTIITIIMKEFKQGTTAIMGFIVTFSGVFNMIANWLIGKTSDYLGVFSGFASILFYAVLLAGLLLIVKRELTFDKIRITREAEIV